ncbi:hypothetical protein AeMF1_002415 [Aphanomyces euteiches]|nr:hypothetical protein AeMF1_002415 [Aphanomyces euteiches]
MDKAAATTTPSMWDLRPAKYKNVLRSVCSFILMMELAERLSYYGINQGLKNFMQKKLGWSAVSANSLKSTWTSLVYMSPLMGAYIADEKWGRYRTIITFGLLYLVGDCLLSVAAHPDVIARHDVAQFLFIFGLFGCIGFGTGAIKSNVITLGADQFNPADSEESQQKTTFFSYFYWCINFGAAFAYGYLASLSVHGTSLIPAEWGYFACFSICSCVMALALCSLRLGRDRYVMLPPSSNAMSKLVRLLWQQSTTNVAAKRVGLGFLVFFISFVVNCVAVALPPNLRTPLSLLAGLAGCVGIVCWVVYGQQSISDQGESSKDLKDLQQVVRVLPFAAFTIVWGCVSDQIDANFQSITQQCDLRLSPTTQLPGAVLGIFDPLAIMILLPLLDKVIYPLYKRVMGKPPSPYGKVCLGLIISTVLMFYVGCFEIIRRDSGPIIVGGAGVVRDEGSGATMNRIHWAWNIPQYVAVALCECFINVTAYDIYYSNVPLHLKSTAQAINLFTVSMGSNVTSIFTLAFGYYIPNNLNDGHLEYMFFGVGAVSFVNVICFVIVMTRMEFGMTPSGYGRVGDPTEVTSTSTGDEEDLEAIAVEDKLGSTQTR